MSLNIKSIYEKNKQNLNKIIITNYLNCDTHSFLSYLKSKYFYPKESVISIYRWIFKKGIFYEKNNLYFYLVDNKYFLFRSK